MYTKTEMPRSPSQKDNFMSTIIDCFETKKKILNAKSLDEIDDITRQLDKTTLRVLIKLIVWSIK